ncbi:MAG TPA: hypothetical protein VGM29_15655 [Polyangiaceae bacterium]|jgi:hypothetical protein
MRAAAIALAIGLCSTQSACRKPSPSCVVSLFGSTQQVTHLAECASLSATVRAGEPHYVLRFGDKPALPAELHAELDLGPRPTTGSFSDTALRAFHATLKTSPTCTFVAGGDAVPRGRAWLELSALDLSHPSAQTVHGQLTLTLRLHAAAQSDCGPVDTETVSLRF